MQHTHTHKRIDILMLLRARTCQRTMCVADSGTGTRTRTRTHTHGLFEQTRSRRLVYGTHAVTHACDNAFSPLARWIFTNNICAPAPLLFTRNPTQPIYSMCDKCRQIIVSRAHKQRQHTNHTRIQKRVGPGRRDCAVLSAVCARHQ